MTGPNAFAGTMGILPRSVLLLEADADDGDGHEEDG